MKEFSEGKYRILLHLQSQDNTRDLEQHREVPYRLCQKGIAEAVELSRGRTSDIITDLVGSDLVNEEVRHVVGLKRRRKVYSLTQKGLEKAEELRNKLKEEKVTIKTDSTEYEIKLEQINSYIDSRDPLLLALNKVNENNLIDLTKSDEKKEDIFVGRKDEMKRLLDCLKRVENNESSVFMIEGNAGIGKTRLVNELKHKALSKGFGFISGKGYYHTSEPYLPFKEVFRPYRQNGEFENIELLEFFDAEDKARAKKVLESDEGKRDAIFFETAENIRSIANKKPLVLFIDDIHRVDKASLMLFHYLADKLRDSPVMFIGAYRPEGVINNKFFEEMLLRMSREKLYEHLKLEPLTIDDTKEIIKGLTGKFKVPQHFVQMIYQVSEGNPLFSKELVKQMIEDDIVDPKNDVFPSEKDAFELPKVVEDIIERRIKRLSKENLKVLQIGSIIGEDIPFSLLHEVTEMDSFELLEYVDILTGSGLWENDPEEDVFHFAHGLIHLSVYESIPEHMRKVLHKEVAETMEQLYQDRLEEIFYDVAAHYENAAESSKAFEYLKKAGDEAEKVYAHEDAIEIYDKALVIADENGFQRKKWDVLERLGDLYRVIGKFDVSLDYYESIPKDELDIKHRQRIYRKRANLFDKKGELNKALDTVEKGLEKGMEENIETARLLKRKGWAEMRMGRYESAAENFLKSLEMAEKYGIKKDIGDIYHALGTVNFYNSKYDEALRYLKKGLKIREETGDISGKASSLSNLGNVYMNRSEIDKALAKFKESMDISEKIGKENNRVHILINLGNAYLKKGELEKAYESYKESYEIFEEMGNKRGLNISFSNLGNYHLLNGDLETALQYHEKSFEMSKENDIKNGIILGHTNMAHIYRHKEDYEKAKENYNASISISEEIGIDHLLVQPLCGLAYILSREGKFDEAVRKAERALEISKELEAKIDEGTSHRFLGMVYREKEMWEKSEDQFERAKEAFEKLNLNIDLAKLQFEYAILCKQMNDEKRRNSYINEAMSLFEEMSMGFWMDKCKQEIKR